MVSIENIFKISISIKKTNILQKNFSFLISNNVKLGFLISNHEQFLLMKLTWNPPMVTTVSKNNFFLLISFLLPPTGSCSKGDSGLILLTKNNYNLFLKRLVKLYS